MCQSQRYGWMHVLGTHDGCAVIAYPQGLRRNTAAMLELRCCCRGMRYGCFRWWRTRVSEQARLPVRGRLVTEELGRDCVVLPWACSVDLRERALACLLKICLCCFKLHHPSRPYPRHKTSSSFCIHALSEGTFHSPSPLKQALRFNQRALRSHTCQHVELTMSAPHGRRLSPCLSPYPELKKREEFDARTCCRSLPLIRR